MKGIRAALNLELALIVALLCMVCVFGLSFLSISIASALTKDADVITAGWLSPDPGNESPLIPPVIPGDVAAADTYWLTDGAGVITGYKLEGPGVNETIPASIDGVPITGTAAVPTKSPWGPLPGFSKLTGSITFPASLTSIGNYAFGNCSNLTVLNLPDSITSINQGAFRNCSGLTGTLDLPASLTSIGIGAFYGNSGLTSLNLPANLTSLGNNAFQGCSGLTGTLDLPASLTSTGNFTFNACSNLTALNLPDSITSIGQSAFNGCSNLTALNYLPINLVSIGSNAFEYCPMLTGSLTIPTTTTSIGALVFYPDPNLTVRVPVAKNAWTKTYLGCGSVETY